MKNRWIFGAAMLVAWSTQMLAGVDLFSLSKVTVGDRALA
jgi:hypothetical protein